MDLLYSVHKKQISQLNLPAHNNILSLCRLSSANILAFAIPYDINEHSPSAWGTFVYICDITSPWHSFKITSSKYAITVLEWDITGKYLLIADTEGNVQIWIQKDYLLSEWIQLYTVQFPGERIIKAVFFHNGRKIIFPTEKRDVTLYMEKFQRVRFAPSVRQFGGVAAEGCLILTATGLLGAFLIPADQSFAGQNVPNGHVGSQGAINGLCKLTPTTQSLSLSRNYLTAAAISFGKSSNYMDGHFRIAIANGETKNKSSVMVQCFKVLVKIIDGKLTITSQSLPSFFLHEGSGRDLPELKITNLSWTTNEDAESLIVVAKSSLGSFVELWSLVEKVTPIHKLLQTNKTEVFKSIAWTNQNSFRHSSLVTDISISKLNFENSYVFLTMVDNTIQILTKEFKRVAGITATALHTFDNEHSCKQPRIGIHIVAHDVTFMGHLLLAIDNQGQIHCFKVPQMYQEQCTNQLALISHVTSLLEYSIVSGYDGSDVFISIRPNLLEGIIEKLSENFTRQPSPVQQYYYVNFLTMKTNLYRLLVSGQSKANDLTCLLMLHSILIAFKSLLRPSDLTSHDKGPAENLAFYMDNLVKYFPIVVLSESSVPDVDKVLLNLDPKDFTVEPSTLQSLQQLIQWVADLALNILAKLPQSGCQLNQTKSSGYEISKDIVALNSIRELLVMIRIWGLLNSLCLPVFSRSVENLDILATLFRLLTRLALNPSEPDEMLLDECCLLPSQVLIPQLQFVSSVTSITSPVLHLNTFPLQFTYNIEPDCLKFWRDIPPIEGGLSNDGMVDSVRNLLLGKKPAIVRKCLRCGTCSSVGSVAKTAAMKAWEQRWANNCRCGGFWVLQRN